MRKADIRNDDDDEFDRMTPAEREQARQGALRKMFTALQLWQACPRKECQRASACTGTGKFCTDTNWRRLPQAHRNWVQTALTASNAGASPAEACREADAAGARFAALTEGKTLD